MEMDRELCGKTTECSGGLEFEAEEDWWATCSCCWHCEMTTHIDVREKDGRHAEVMSVRQTMSETGKGRGSPETRLPEGLSFEEKSWPASVAPVIKLTMRIEVRSTRPIAAMILSSFTGKSNIYPCCLTPDPDPLSDPPATTTFVAALHPRVNSAVNSSRHTSTSRRGHRGSAPG